MSTPIPYLGTETVAMTRYPHDLPTLIDSNSGYMGNQWSPDISILGITNLSSWWWDTPVYPEAQYLSMLWNHWIGDWDTRTGDWFPRATTLTMYRPRVSELRTFNFAGDVAQGDLDSGLDSTIGTPWFDWGDMMLQFMQDTTTYDIYFKTYDLSASATIPYVVPSASTATLLTQTNPGVHPDYSSVQVYAQIYSSICDDGTEIPILLVHNTVDGKICVMPFDVAAYPSLLPTWTHTTIPNPTGIQNFWIVPNPATNTNLLITANGFYAAGTVQAATLTIDSSRVATVGALTTYAIDSGTPASLSGSVDQTSKYGLIADDVSLGHVPGPWLPLQPSGWYKFAPDLSGFKQYIFTGPDFTPPPLADGPQRPRMMMLDQDGLVWIWDFRSGAVWYEGTAPPPPPSTAAYYIDGAARGDIGYFIY